MDFNDVGQKLAVSVALPSPIDLSGRQLQARVMLESGLSSDVAAPGGAKLFVKSGSAYVYASGPWTNLGSEGVWTVVTLSLDAPDYQDTAEYSATDVREVGLEVATGAESTGISSAVIRLDDIHD